MLEGNGAASAQNEFCRRQQYESRRFRLCARVSDIYFPAPGASDDVPQPAQDAVFHHAGACSARVITAPVSHCNAATPQRLSARSHNGSDGTGRFRGQRQPADVVLHHHTGGKAHDEIKGDRGCGSCGRCLADSGRGGTDLAQRQASEKAYEN
jgi:hypothetical protein